MAFAERGSGTGRLWGCWAIPLGFLLLIVVSCGFSNGYLPMRRFDSEAWRQAGADNSATPVRLQMIEWLTKSGQLDGLSRAEVAALLGPANKTEYFADWDFVYWLGPERGMFRIDSEWLVIRFGRDGRVSDYQVVRD